MKLDAYTIVFLRRPPSAPDLSEERLDALQEEHLAFNARMREAGRPPELAGRHDQDLAIQAPRVHVVDQRRERLVHVRGAMSHRLA